MSAISLTRSRKEAGIALTKFLLNEGAEIDTTDDTGRTAFLMACHWGLMDIVRLLLNYGPNIDA